MIKPYVPTVLSDSDLSGIPGLSNVDPTLAGDALYAQFANQGHP